MRGIRRVRWVSLVAVVMVSACTGGRPDPTATTAPVTVSSSSVSTSATRPASATTSAGGTSTTTGPSATGVPPEAQVDTADGAVAFVKFALVQVNRAYRTMAPDLLDSVFSPECPGCQALKVDVAKRATMKHSASSDLWSGRSFVPEKWDAGNAEISLLIDQSKVDFIDELGRRVDSVEAKSKGIYVTLRFNSGWRIVRWQGVQQ